MSLNDFELGKELGKGTFGSVTIVKRKEDQKIYAMKRVKIGRLSQKEKLNSFNEVRILASIDHKNIIGYKEAFFDDKSKTLNIVMEFADGGDLNTKIKELKQKKLYFEEKTIWSTLIQILQGLNYLHKSCIIHRDLKSANIFLTKDGAVKIGDLNVSKILNKMVITYTQTGTPYFASPEIWNDQPYDYKCDIWSVGCIIYEMASLHVPFRGVSMQNLYKNVLRGIYQQIPQRYSDDLKQIIKLILVVNPKNRPSSKELLENPIIKRKMIELGFEKNQGLIKKNSGEKAKLMKTIKIPVNMSQINRELPQKKYEKNEMLLNDEYETAKRTFYLPQPLNNNNNNNNDINNNNKYNADNNNDKLLDKDLLDIQKITNSITSELNNEENNNNKNIGDNNINNNIIIEPYINSIKSSEKKLKNIDNNIINSHSAKKESKENNSEINNNILKNNKFSNINYDQVFNNINEKEKTKLINRVVKTENNTNEENNINSIIKEPKPKKNIKNNLLKLDLINNDFCINNKNKKKENNEIKDNFKEKYNKLIEDINKNKLTTEPKNKNLNEKEKEKIKNQIKDIEKDVIQSRKELDEINKNLNLLIQYNKDKKQIKYKSREHLIEQNLFRYKNKNTNESHTNKINNNSYLNNIDNNININNNNYLYEKQNKKRKINNHVIDMNLNMNDITNNKRPFYMNHKSSRPNTSNYIRYLPTIIGNNNYNNNHKEKNDIINGLNRNKNEFDRYNIFSNYNNDNRNNYYFNNCNFINNNNNPNENCLANNPYNNNYLRNPYSNNYNLYNNCNQMYKEYFNNFMKYLSLRNQKVENENKTNINNNLINIDNNNENNINQMKKRKIIYEKINIKKIGNEYSYQSGPSKIKYVGGGNYYNQCHKAIIKNNLENNNNNNFNKNYLIQNLFSYGNKQKTGPRIILPNKMFN